MDLSESFGICFPTRSRLSSNVPRLSGAQFDWSLTTAHIKVLTCPVACEGKVSALFCGADACHVPAHFLP